MRTRDEILADIDQAIATKAKYWNDYQNKLRKYGADDAVVVVARTLWETAVKKYEALLQELYNLGMENISAPDSFWELDVPAYSGAMDSNSVKKEIGKTETNIETVESLVDLYRTKYEYWYNSFLKKPGDTNIFYNTVTALIDVEKHQKELYTYESYLEYLQDLLGKEEKKDIILDDAVEYYNKDIKDDNIYNGSAPSDGKETNNLFVNNKKEAAKEKNTVGLLPILLLGGAFYFLLRE